MNSVQLVGRVGQDPQIFGEGSKRVARVSLATTERGVKLLMQKLEYWILMAIMIVMSLNTLMI